MTRDQAMAKVKKLMRLSTSSNMHEAAAAMRQAQALMRLHAIEAGEVGDLDHDPDPIGERPSAARRGMRIAVDLSRLAGVVSRTFGVEVYWRVGYAESRTGDTFRQIRARFVGPGSRAELASYAFDVLQRQMERDKRQHLRRVRVRKNRAARGDCYGIGWVNGVAKVLEPWAITDAERNAITVWMAKHGPKLETVNCTARESRAATINDRYLGYASGARATLNRGVGGMRQAQLESKP